MRELKPSLILQDAAVLEWILCLPCLLDMCTHVRTDVHVAGLLLQSFYHPLSSYRMAQPVSRWYIREVQLVPVFPLLPGKTAVSGCTLPSCKSVSLLNMCT